MSYAQEGGALNAKEAYWILNGKEKLYGWKYLVTGDKVTLISAEE